MKNDKLFSDFKASSYEEWKLEAEKLLKGAPFDKKMFTKTAEGIVLKPIYMREDLPSGDMLPESGSNLRGTSSSGYRGTPWIVSQDMYASTPKEFNEKILNALNLGQTGVEITLDKASANSIDADLAQDQVGVGGLSISTKEDFDVALKDVATDCVNINIYAGVAFDSVAALFYSSIKDTSKLTGGIFADPLSTLIKEGSMHCDLDCMYDRMFSLAQYNVKNVPNFGAVGVDAYAYSCAGASAVEELAFAFATASKYMSELIARGLSADEAAQTIRFRFGIGSNFFMEIAKLRAARLLWTKIVKAFGGNDESCKIKIFTRTTTFNKTVFDPYVNMLRTATESFSAILGICDGITVSCFDEIVRVPDAISMRFARNQQIVLQEECNLCDVVDPVGGSWYIENLSVELAKKSLELFKEIEVFGGMEKYILEGKAQEKVKAVYDSRKKNYDARRNVIVGTNSYANIAEKILEPHVCDRAVMLKERGNEVSKNRKVDSLNIDASAGAKTIEEMIKGAIEGASIEVLTDAICNCEADTTVEALQIKRASSDFEALRNASTAFQKKTGSLPKIFLATMGSLVQHKARGDFIRGFFQVGAFDVVYPKGFDSADNAAKAFADSGAKFAVICSTDDTYPELVPAVTKAIKAVKSDAKVFLAGVPAADQEASYKEAGLDGAVNIKSNNYETLKSFLSELGVI